tara:strand:- start:487 stop:921 length:435 start_codon:yes stop_codon:yes gene_type:complete
MTNLIRVTAINMPQTISRAYLREFRDRFEQTLNEFGEQEGLTLQAKAINYGDNTFNVKVEVTMAGDAEEAAEMQFKAALSKNPWLFEGISEEDYGTTWKSAYGSNYRLVGLKPRATKYPLIVERDGKRYKLPLKGFTSHKAVEA